MTAYTAIADVSAALVALLRDRLQARGDTFGVDPSAVQLVSPAAVSAEGDTRLGLYLYGVAENPSLTNADRSRVDSECYRGPPLALDLEYLLTAYPAQRGTDETARSLDQQRMLGLAMQVFHDAGRLDAEALPSSVDNAVAPQLSMASAGPERSLWHTFQGTPYRPSVAYQVGPVLVASTREERVPQVTERETAVEGIE